MNILLFIAIALRVIAAWLTIRLFFRFRNWQTAVFALMATFIALRTYIWIDLPTFWPLKFTYETEHMLTLGSGIIVLLFVIALYGLFTNLNNRLETILAEKESKEKAEIALLEANLQLEKSNNMLEARIEESTRQLRGEIEELKFSERALSESEARFRDIVESTMDWVWETNADFQIIYLSERSGGSGKGSLDSGMGELLPAFLSQGTSQQSGLKFINVALVNQTAFSNIEIEMKSRDGEPLYVRTNGKPIFNQFGEFTGYRGTLTDITEAKEAFKIRDKLVAAFDKLDAGFSFWDSEDRFVTCNTKYETLMGKASGKIEVGMAYEDFLRDQAKFLAETNPDIRVNDWVNERLAEHSNIEFSKEYLHSNGAWVRIDKQKLQDGSIISFHSDISDLKHREAELELSREQAESANKAKSEFLSSMSHELRTPLNAILGFGQLLAATSAEEFTQNHRENAEHIVTAGNYLLTLTNEILDLAKIEAGNIELTIEAVSVAEIMEICVEMTEAQYSDCGISIVQNIDLKNLPPVSADPIRLRQIFINLLSNAIKYNEPGGTVLLNSKLTEKNMARISVIDTGLGISADQQTELFKPFNRAGREGSDIEGTGIGLLVTRDLIELMEGQMGFESEEGIGSTFWIELPIAQNLEAEIQLDEADLGAGAGLGQQMASPAE